MDTQKLTIAIGSDHAGFDLKEEIKIHLSEKNFNVLDCGTFDKESADYPKFAFAVAKKVADKISSYGIIVDGAGIGSAMVANKVKGVRGSLCYNLLTAKNAREHNDANVLTLGAGLIAPSLARQIVDVFLSTHCTIDRHLKRVKMIDDLDLGKELKFESDRPEKPDIKEENLVDLSSDDIVRVADRLREILVDQNSSSFNVQPASQALCGNKICSDCGFCAVKKPDTIRRFIDLGVERISYAIGGQTVPQDIAKFIDHTLLKPDATSQQIIKLCGEAREFNFASVCINPTYVALAAQELAGSTVDVCTVVGFPLGSHISEIKGLETRRAIRDGAREIDMVINIGALKGFEDDIVYKDIRLVVEA